MQAITSRTYGEPSVIHIEELPAPVPKSGELLIRNHATVVSGAESTARSGEDLFARPFTVAIHTFERAGRVVAISVDFDTSVDGTDPCP
ncbi:hypothetical protein [Pseudarthrobacter sp. H2]|uniref:hypothetical protein n=1 Tax=Pseudarthrobacter sp. H2 TaxID=3418415 RepID=UPI003CE7A43C